MAFSRIWMLAFALLASAGPLSHEGSIWAASTFIGSTVMEIGPDGRQVTIKTIQGESFSLDVVSPDVVKGVRKGDQVSLELDAQDRVNKMVKVGDDAERPKPRMSGESEY